MPLPSNLNYTGKIESSFATSYKQNINPNGPSYGYALGDTIQFNIPTANNLLLVPSESYLLFDIAVNNTSGAVSSYRLDSCGIHGLFSKVKESHANNTLFEMDNYGMFAKMLFDLQSPLSNTYGKSNVLVGSRSDFVVPVNVAATGTAYNFSANQTNSGEILGSSIANGSSTTVRTYAVNLISILGSLCPKYYLPLFAMKSSSLLLELTLVSSLANFLCCTSAVGSITISNVSFCGNFVKLGDSGMAELISKLPDPSRIEFPITNWKNFYTTIAPATSITINNTGAKFSSLRSLFLAQRQYTGTATFFPFSTCSLTINDTSGATPLYGSYQWKIGAVTIPAQAPTRLTEMFAEVCKAMGSLSSIEYNPNIDYNSYRQTTATAVTDTALNGASSSSFYIGIDLENFPNTPKDQVFSGINTTSEDVQIAINYTASPTAPTGTIRYDIFACFDSIIICENGIANRKI